MGWRVEGDMPNHRKLVIIAAPHTTNWDFIVAIAAKLALGLQALWLGKHTLFKGPLGWLMRSLGGVPVNRSASHDVVSGIVEEFGKRDKFVLALAPEGTRKKVARWRTGFYHVAHATHTVIVPVAFNWGVKTVQIMPAFTTTGDVDRDIAELQSRFANVRGRRAN
jgi:1-acyl-sn-glycerol-3-phosphate acyltransferase